MMVINLGKGNSLLNQFIAELRDVEIQKDAMRFRKNLERIGQIFAYEISKKLEYENKEVVTPLGSTEMSMLKNYPVLASIIRAGLPFHHGLLNFFDKSDNAFISAYRKYYKDGNFEVHVQYVSKPLLEGKDLILIDPMLATGNSMALTYRELTGEEKPRHTHLISIIASLEGVNYIKRNFSSSEVTLWVGAIDDELTAQAYIVPGLGDAGDLAYGSKI
ncbi:MAG TPA: uracil phosphoribosyltransferase [Bacteroidales bacterium]|nr:uracil phosphoribosyltransferase [Bacteroidales bacterium]